MKEITLPYHSTIHKDEIESSEDIKTLRMVHNQLLRHGFCYVKILEGDYKGSIAKFYPNDYELKRGDVIRNVTSYNRDFITVNIIWRGNLKWDKRKNNPIFYLRSTSAVVLQDYEGETDYQRIDLKKGKDKLIANAKLYDINGKEISVGDSVLYLNLRYGSGGSLCYGVVKEFVAHVRQGHVSVLVVNKTNQEESDLNYPSQQICIL